MTDSNQQEGYARNPWDYVPSGGPWHDLRQKASSITNAGADMRIGDAERAEMVDELGKHFSEGRLTEEEFRERMDRAMSAKTRGDLNGLLSDLPLLGQPPGTPLVPRQTRHLRRATRTVVLVCLAIALTAPLVSTVSWPHVSWLVVVIVAVVLLRHHDHRQRALRHSRAIDTARHAG